MARQLQLGWSSWFVCRRPSQPVVSVAESRESIRRPASGTARVADGTSVGASGVAAGPSIGASALVANGINTTTAAAGRGGTSTRRAASVRAAVAKATHSMMGATDGVIKAIVIDEVTKRVTERLDRQQAANEVLQRFFPEIAGLTGDETPQQLRALRIQLALPATPPTSPTLTQSDEEPDGQPMTKRLRAEAVHRRVPDEEPMTKRLRTEAVCDRLGAAGALTCAAEHGIGGSTVMVLPRPSAANGAPTPTGASASAWLANVTLFSPGQVVYVRDSTDELFGQHGVVQGWNGDQAKWEVRMSDGNSILLRTDALAAVSPVLFIDADDADGLVDDGKNAARVFGMIPPGQGGAPAN